MISPFNKRQYEAMISLLDDYDSGHASIRDVAVGLEGLVNAIETVDPEWKNIFNKYWGVFEDISSYKIVSGENTEDRAVCDLLKCASNELRNLINNAMV